MFLPLGVGIAALLNVELSAKNRLAQTEAATNSMDHAPSRPPVVGVKLGGPVSASEKRRLLARRARAGEDVKVRGYSSLSRSEKKEQEGVEFKVGGTKPNTARIVTNILRFASVAFIPVAGLAPSVRNPPLSLHPRTRKNGGADRFFDWRESNRQFVYIGSLQICSLWYRMDCSTG